MRAIAGEILEISKQSFELTTKTLEKLRTVHGVDEVAAIQADFMKEAFEHAAQLGESLANSSRPSRRKSQRPIKRRGSNR